MQSMDAIEFLQQLKKLNKMIENQKDDLIQWRMIATGTTAQMGGERVQSSGSKQKMADAIDNFVDIENEIKESLEQSIAMRKDIINVIEQVPNATQYDLLYKVYVRFLTLQEVADIYGRSYNWAKQMHRRALSKVQTILDAREQKEP